MGLLCLGVIPDRISECDTKELGVVCGYNSWCSVRERDWQCGCGKLCCCKIRNPNRILFSFELDLQYMNQMKDYCVYEEKVNHYSIWGSVWLGVGLIGYHQAWRLAVRDVVGRIVLGMTCRISQVEGA